MANVSFLQKYHHHPENKRNTNGAELHQEEEDDEEEEEEVLEVAKPQVKKPVVNGRRNDRYSQDIENNEGVVSDL